MFQPGKHFVDVSLLWIISKEIRLKQLDFHGKLLFTPQMTHWMKEPSYGRI